MSTVITRGYGTFGTANLVITRGYGGIAVITPPTVTPVTEPEHGLTTRDFDLRPKQRPLNIPPPLRPRRYIRLLPRPAIATSSTRIRLALVSALQPAPASVATIASAQLHAAAALSLTHLSYAQSEATAHFAIVSEVDRLQATISGYRKRERVRRELDELALIGVELPEYLKKELVR